MPTGESTPSPEPSSDKPAYELGQPVRVQYEAGDQTIVEDDWSFYGRNEETGNYIALKKDEAQKLKVEKEIPPEVFEEWQRERAGQISGEIAVAMTVETSPPVEAIIQEEGNAEDALRGKWWDYDEESGKYSLTVNPKDLAALIEVPSNIIIAGAERGFPPETLISAKHNYFTALRLRKAGINWGLEALPKADSSFPVPENDNPQRLSSRTLKKPEDVEAIEDPEALAAYLGKVGVKDTEEYREHYKIHSKKDYEDEREKYKQDLDKYLNIVGLKEGFKTPVDPLFYLEAWGNRTQISTEEMADLIEKHPRAVRKELSRPGGINLPLLRRIGWLYLAYANHRQELRDRRDNGLGRNYMDGLLRLGLPRIRRNWRYIKAHDTDVAVYRNKLGIWNNHEYKGPEQATPRRDLAENVLATRNRHEAIRLHKIHDPDHVYEHAPVKAAIGKYAADKKKYGFIGANKIRKEEQQEDEQREEAA